MTGRVLPTSCPDQFEEMTSSWILLRVDTASVGNLMEISQQWNFLGAVIRTTLKPPSLQGRQKLRDVQPHRGMMCCSAITTGNRPRRGPSRLTTPPCDASLEKSADIRSSTAHVSYKTIIISYDGKYYLEGQTGNRFRTLSCCSRAEPAPLPTRHDEQPSSSMPVTPRTYHAAGVNPPPSPDNRFQGSIQKQPRRFSGRIGPSCPLPSLLEIDMSTAC